MSKGNKQLDEDVGYKPASLITTRHSAGRSKSHLLRLCKLPELEMPKSQLMIREL